MKVNIVYISEDRIDERIHLAFDNDSGMTFCGRPVASITRRESMRENTENCYRCQQKAQTLVVLSLKAGAELTRKAGLDWKMLKRRASVL